MVDLSCCDILQGLVVDLWPCKLFLLYRPDVHQTYLQFRTCHPTLFSPFIFSPMSQRHGIFDRFVERSYSSTHKVQSKASKPKIWLQSHIGAKLLLKLHADEHNILKICYRRKLVYYQRKTTITSNP